MLKWRDFNNRKVQIQESGTSRRGKNETTKKKGRLEIVRVGF